MVTEADFKQSLPKEDKSLSPCRIYESLPNPDDHRLQDILYRACGCTAQSSDSASALELGKHNHLRETYMLGVYEWDYTQLRYTIDDH